MAMSGGKDDGQPMMEMNTTPLIDVMLVLLIMFIITIPVQTHAIPIDLPQGSDSDNVPVETEKNKLVISPDNQILWNGNGVSQGQLVDLLSRTKAMAVEPELQFQPEPRAQYQLVQQVLKIIKASGVTKFGFVGNERYRMFEGGPAGVNPTQTAG